MPNISEHLLLSEINFYRIHGTYQHNPPIMTSQIPRKALNLPQLLSSLPHDGLGALVRPSSSPNSIFRITRSKLKFRQRSEVGEVKAGSEVGDELLAVSGKVWGMRFVNGMYPFSHSVQQCGLTQRTLCTTYQIRFARSWYRFPDQRKDKRTLDTSQGR